MANLKLIKDFAAIKGLTIEQLATKAQVTTQAIHLMGRSGKTKMETFEKIAAILEVPPYVFYDENFDIQMYRAYIEQGHHNPSSFFGPTYNGGVSPFPSTGNAAGHNETKTILEERIKECHELIKAKDETIKALTLQIDELRADKEYFRSEIVRLREELEAIRHGI